MAFQFFKWLLRARDAPEAVTMEEFFDLFTDTYVRELAFQSCVNLTANAISKCEVKTYLKGGETKGAEYYLWNLSPNQNQNSSAFWHKLIQRMYEDRAALVVENAGKLYVADTWTRKEYALYDDEFSQVAVGGFTFRRTFAASEVLFFELAAQDAKLVVDGLYESYAKLIACGMKGYQKSRGEKGTLELDANAAGDKRFQETFEEIKNQGFRRFAEAENAVLPMWKGMKYTSLASKTYNSDTTRDIRAHDRRRDRLYRPGVWHPTRPAQRLCAGRGQRDKPVSHLLRGPAGRQHSGGNQPQAKRAGRASAGGLCENRHQPHQAY